MTASSNPTGSSETKMGHQVILRLCTLLGYWIWAASERTWPWAKGLTAAESSEACSCPPRSQPLAPQVYPWRGGWVAYHLVHLCSFCERLLREALGAQKIMGHRHPWEFGRASTDVSFTVITGVSMFRAQTLHGFKSLVLYFPAGWPWSGYLTSLCVSFLLWLGL